MAQTNLSIRVDEEIKRKADKLFADLGLNMSTAINIFLRQAILKGGVPFKITISTPDDGLPPNFDRARLRKAIAGLNAGKGQSHELIEAE